MKKARSLIKKQKFAEKRMHARLRETKKATAVLVGFGLPETDVTWIPPRARRVIVAVMRTEIANLVSQTSTDETRDPVSAESLERAVVRVVREALDLRQTEDHTSVHFAQRLAAVRIRSRPVDRICAVICSVIRNVRYHYEIIR